MRRGAGGKRTAQVFGVIADRLNLDLAEKFREYLQYRLAVFQHVRNASRCACIVFKNKEIIFACAHNVGANNVGVNAARG